MIEKMNEKIAATKEPSFTSTAAPEVVVPKKKRRIGLFEKM